MASPGFLGAVEELRINQGVPGGTYLGYQDIDNPVMLGLTFSGEIKQRESNKHATKGQPVDSVPLNGATALKLTFDSQSPDEMALAHQSDAEVFGQVAESTQTASVTLILNRWVDIDPDGRINVSNVAISGKTASTDGGVTGDFLVDEANAMIKALNSGTAGAKTVTYDVEAQAGYQIDGGSKAQIRGAIFAAGINMADDKHFKFWAWDASLQSNTEFNLFSKEFATPELNGFMNLVTGKPTGYRLLTGLSA